MKLKFRGDIKQRVTKRVSAIRDKYKTQWRKKELTPGIRQEAWDLEQVHEKKLYGTPKIHNQDGKTYISYMLLKGWNYVFKPEDLDEEGKPIPGRQPKDKNPITEEVIEVSGKDF